MIAKLFSLTFDIGGNEHIFFNKELIHLLRNCQCQGVLTIMVVEMETFMLLKAHCGISSCTMKMQGNVGIF